MHFHVAETMLGASPTALGGRSSIRYPSDRPAFGHVTEAIDAVAASARIHWGTPAATHVELALFEEISREKQDATVGALAGWADPSGEGAWWSLRACDCADGTLAQIFTDGRL